MLINNGNVKPWENTKIELHLKGTHKICCLQIIDTLPKSWTDFYLKDKGNVKNLVAFDHHIVRNSQIRSLNKHTSKELY